MGMVHLVPSCMNYKVKEVAELIFEEVYKLHGLPKGIVSDRDMLFTSIFWSHLHKLIGSKLKMSSAYHPEADGATERANRVIGAMLRQCISADQKNWATMLPAIEFVINSVHSEITGYASFFLNNGRMPRSKIWDNATKTEYPGVCVFTMRTKQAIISTHGSILESWVKQARDANRKRHTIPFTEKDLVYISTKNISFLKGLARKLNPKCIDPYPILKDFGNGSFRIELPLNLKARGIHDVFHALLLRSTSQTMTDCSRQSRKPNGINWWDVRGMGCRTNHRSFWFKDRLPIQSEMEVRRCDMVAIWKGWPFRRARRIFWHARDFRCLTT